MVAHLVRLKLTLLRNTLKKSVWQTVGLVLGILYMLVARRLLAGRPIDTAASRRPTLRAWIERYRLAEREQRVFVTERSPLIGKRLDEIPARASGVNLLAIERGTGLSARMLRPTAQTQIMAGDILLVDANAPAHDVEALRTLIAGEAVE